MFLTTKKFVFFITISIFLTLIPHEILATTHQWLNEISRINQKICIIKRQKDASPQITQNVIESLQAMIESIIYATMQTQKLSRAPISHNEVSEVVSLLKQLKDRIEPYSKIQEAVPEYKKAAAIVSIASETLFTLTGVVYLLYRMTH